MKTVLGMPGACEACDFGTGVHYADRGRTRVGGFTVYGRNTHIMEGVLQAHYTFITLALPGYYNVITTLLTSHYVSVIRF